MSYDIDGNNQLTSLKEMKSDFNTIRQYISEILLKKF